MVIEFTFWLKGIWKVTDNFNQEEYGKHFNMRSADALYKTSFKEQGYYSGFTPVNSW